MELQKKTEITLDDKLEGRKETLLSYLNVMMRKSAVRYAKLDNPIAFNVTTDHVGDLVIFVDIPHLKKRVRKKFSMQKLIKDDVGIEDIKKCVIKTLSAVNYELNKDDRKKSAGEVKDERLEIKSKAKGPETETD